MIHHLLDREGYQVDAVQGGDKAVRTIKKRTPDLLITDLLIPEKEGLELI
ncbi:response regulator [candidate division KSB1 bacterium]|nr:response regulator [candidate division KSB1 bacterium]